MIDNPHCDEEEGGEFFVFGSPATAACFRWLLENRSNYSHYIDNLTSYTNDPLGIQLAYDLRRKLQEHYWAALPPDTLPAWLSIVRMLQIATVPDAYREGALAPLYTAQVATMPTNLLHIVQLGGDEIWLQGRQALIFDRQPVNVFVIEPDTDAEEVLFDSLCGVNHALHEESGIFCIWRHNPGSFYSSYGNPILVYGIPGGYMCNSIQNTLLPHRRWP